MSNISGARGIQIILRGLRNLLQKKPLMVSFEITHSCNANCAHCDKGGKIENEKLASFSQFAFICKDLNPVVAQISGGEPLLRKDILEIVRSIRSLGNLPYIVLVTNASLLTLEKYKLLKQAGIDGISISLDFPNEKHDQNRNMPGLFLHLKELIPQLSAQGNKDITIHTVIRKESLEYICQMANLAEKWGVNFSLTSYNPLRTGSFAHFIDGDDLKRFKEVIADLKKFGNRTGLLLTSDRVLFKFYQYFQDKGMPGCQAGIKHLVVNPDGKLVPCAMFYKARYKTQKELIDRFTLKNKCSQCYISTRANTEKSIPELFWNNLTSQISFIRKI